MERKVIEIATRIQSAEEKLNDILAEEPRPAIEDLPYYDSDYRYRQEINSIEQLIKSYDQEVAKDKEQLDQIGRKKQQLQRQAEDYQDFLGREAITIDAVAASNQGFPVFEKESCRWE